MVTAVQNEGRIGWPGCGIDSRSDPDTTGIFLDSIRFYIREIERRCSNSIGSMQFVISGDRIRWAGRFDAAIWSLQRVCWQFRLHNFWYLSRSQYWTNCIDLFVNVHIREVSR